ncbi:hypothetical protein CBR_g48171, partial [Chara braunii]
DLHYGRDLWGARLCIGHKSVGGYGGKALQHRRRQRHRGALVIRAAVFDQLTAGLEQAWVKVRKEGRHPDSRVDGRVVGQFDIRQPLNPILLVGADESAKEHLCGV